MTDRVVLLENGLARRRERDRIDAERAERETEVPCAGCGHLRVGPGLFCSACRWSGSTYLVEAA